MVNLLDPTYIRDAVDYSFGDNSGEGIVPDFHMHPANINNLEFITKYRQILNSGRKVMTLFIDNIRLYKRDNYKHTGQETNIEEIRNYKDARIKELHKDNDLLQLCYQLADMNFIIFTGFEDTPIDEEIFKNNRIPPNVLGIYASNSISFGEKVHAFPYGIQRKMNDQDNRMKIIESMIDDATPAKKLLYVNHSVHEGVASRENLNEIFSKKSFATVDTFRLQYSDYYKRIKEHKFMLCPTGNATGCECHRDWEALYMRRVPIVLDSPYYREIFKNFPVLYVNKWEDITEQLLLKNNDLYEKALELDMNLLDIKVIYEKILSEHGIETDNLGKSFLKKSASTRNLIKVLCEIKIKECASPYMPPSVTANTIDRAIFANLFNDVINFDGCIFTFDSEEDAQSYMNTNLFPHLKARQPKFVIDKVYTTI